MKIDPAKLREGLGITRSEGPEFVRARWGELVKLVLDADGEQGIREAFAIMTWDGETPTGAIAFGKGAQAGGNGIAIGPGATAAAGEVVVDRAWLESLLE